MPSGRVPKTHRDADHPRRTFTRLGRQMSRVEPRTQPGGTDGKHNRGQHQEFTTASPGFNAPPNRLPPFRTVHRMPTAQLDYGPFGHASIILYPLRMGYFRGLCRGTGRCPPSTLIQSLAEREQPRG